jgi:hypothetical protein
MNHKNQRTVVKFSKTNIQLISFRLVNQWRE